MTPNQISLYLDLPYSILKLEGNDSFTFLQNLCTQDVIKNELGVSTVLDRKGKIIFEFSFYHLSQNKGIALLIENEKAKRLNEHLEKLIFVEDVELSLLNTKPIYCEGLNSEQTLFAWMKINHKNDLSNSTSTTLPLIAVETISNELHLLPNFHSIQGGFWIFFKDEDSKKSTLKNLSENFQVLNSSSESYKTNCLLNKRPSFKNEFSEVLLNETNQLNNYLDLKKGCYPGQEIVTRIDQRGQVGKTLQLLESPTPVNTPLYKQNEKEFKNCLSFSSGNKSYLWAFLNKEELLDAQGKGLSILTSLDPNQESLLRLCKSDFKKNFKERAEENYNLGIKHFHGLELTKAILAFKRSIWDSPKYEEALEALAMSYEKNGQEDLAIQANKTLSQHHPLSIMSYANLSRLYMKKGWIEKAEEQQAKSTEISFAKANQESNGDINQSDIAMMEEQRQKINAQKERKLAIFKKVLELDPHDDVALFGLCKSNCDSGKWEVALEYGLTLLEHHPKYSAAYPSVAKSYLGKKNIDEAVKILKLGIDVAKKQGDMMPQKQMERMLTNI